MGKGDKKTAKGKRTMGSYGNTRKKNTSTPIVVIAKEKKEAKVVAPKEEKPKKVVAKKEVTEKTEVKKPAVKKTTAKESENKEA
jgi:30S ribosomal protein S31